MASSGLYGPYKLTQDGIDAAVKHKSAGAYALGQVNDKGTFMIHYVGRADSDVNARLKDHASEWYPEFKFDYFSSAKAAFEKECYLYHDFNPPDNKVHPARPTNANWECPRCDAFD